MGKSIEMTKMYTMQTIDAYLKRWTDHFNVTYNFIPIHIHLEFQYKRYYLFINFKFMYTQTYISIKQINNFFSSPVSYNKFPLAPHYQDATSTGVTVSGIIY